MWNNRLSKGTLASLGVVLVLFALVAFLALSGSALAVRALAGMLGFAAGYASVFLLSYLAGKMNSSFKDRLFPFRKIGLVSVAVLGFATFALLLDAQTIVGNAARWFGLGICPSALINLARPAATRRDG